MNKTRICLQAGNIELPTCENLDLIKVVFGTSMDWSSLTNAKHYSKEQLDKSLFEQTDVIGYNELDFQHCLNFVLENQATRALYERDHTLSALIFADADLERICFNAYIMLKKHRINVLITHNTPHQTVFHVVGLVASYLHISSYSIRDSALWWRVTLEKGLKWGEQVRLEYVNKKGHQDVSDVKNFIESKRKSYDQAITEMEDRILKKHKSKAYPTELLWKDFVIDLKQKGLLRALKSARFKLSVSRSFSKHAVLKTDPRINHENYVLFYLHYQPERTTLPEGGIYNQQILAIRSLRRYLPAEMSIVVKEHPATFRYRIHSKYRNAEFYRLISEINNTFIIEDLKNDFDLLDNSIFVSSIRGTVLIESVIRGKQVIYFSNAPFKGMPGSYFIYDLPPVSDFLKECTSKTESLKLEIEDYLLDQYQVTVGEEVVGKEKYSSNEEYWLSSGLLLAHLLENQEVFN